MPTGDAVNEIAEEEEDANACGGVGEPRAELNAEAPAIEENVGTAAPEAGDELLPDDKTMLIDGNAAWICAEHSASLSIETVAAGMAKLYVAVRIQRKSDAVSLQRAA